MKIDIADIVLIILFIISIVVGLWYLFGDSPTFEQSMIIFLMAAVFGMAVNMSRDGVRLRYVERDLKDLKANVKGGFNRIKEDMDLIKKKLKI